MQEVENDGVENGRVENGRVENDGVENGRVENGRVENGRVENDGVENGGVENDGQFSKKKKGTKAGPRSRIPIRFWSDSCKMPVWVPAIHGSCRRSLWSPRVITEPSSSLSVAVSAFFAAVADTTTNQSGWTMNIRHRHQTLLYSHIYNKMSIKFIFKGIKFVLQRNRFLHLRVNEDVLDWSQLISHESTKMKTNGHVHMQLSSHLRMKTTTSSTISGNSSTVLRSWSEIGTSFSLSNWPENTWMLLARLFIVSYDSFWVFKCCRNNQRYYWCWK